MRTEKNRILLVEDDLIAQKVCKLMLEKRGFMVDIASSGGKAVELATDNEYDFIFMDIGLGDTDGYAVTTQIRHMTNRNAAIPIVALTAHSLGEVNPKSHACGMNGAMNKPLTDEKIIKVIEQYIG